MKIKDFVKQSGPHITRGIRNTGQAVLLGLALVVAATIVDGWGRAESTLRIERAQAARVQPDPIGNPKSATEIDVPTDATIFGEKVPLDNWEVRERFEREFYYNLQNADQIVMWWKRSGRYFPAINQALEQAGLPTDLKYLAVAESGLRNVKSPANANGFWQFIPGTGTRFGLRVDDQIDERLDPVKSTNAAISYFKYMKAMLPTWTLVAAGYNMGEDNVTQAMAWQHANSYWNLFLNEETMRYVLRIAAIKELMVHADKYGLNFDKMQPFRTVGTKTVSVTGPVSAIADWAQQQGFLYKDVKMLNPWLVGRAIPAGTWQIALPLTDADRATIK